MASTDLNGECKVDVIVSDKPRKRAHLRKEGKNMKSHIEAFLVKIWKLGKEDPRRLIHSMKFGAALSLVSLLYLIDPLFNGVGDNAIWAVLTVVVVLEFTAGTTLSKGLNRGLGTLMAGFLATCVSYLSRHAGEVGHAIVIGFSVFILGAGASFARFFPTVKRRYDYGVVIFILTFNLIAVSGYRVDNILRLARVRLSTIAIGCGLCLVISVLVYPIWAGEDLHNFTAQKYEDLARSLEGCVQEYFDGPGDEVDEDESDKTSAEDVIYEGYKSVLDSKAKDESLATFASWEPRHGPFRHRYPWKQYVKIGANLRHLAYSIVALHGCLRSEIQTPDSVRSVLRKPCLKVSEEAAKLLRELSCSIRHMRRSNSGIMMEYLQFALKDLQTALNGLPKHFNNLRRWHSDKNKGIQSQIDQQEEPINSPNEEIQCCAMSLEEPTTTRLFRRGVSLRDQQQDEGKSLSHTQSHVSVEEKSRGHSIEYAEELPLATFAWLLVESVVRIEHVVEAADELAMRAHFKTCISSHHAKSRKASMKVSGPETPRNRVLESHSTSQSAE
ncbi:aluminum-activated malate transporter 14 [Cryptomeria japonica]|uniref:aluminum-activated malate transporter 14 n=1 Tax=Cryptomeria japonica TaxID=3369 RepID=UPI0027DAA2B2|nr:aluminum-activated malate transporter 14 [Cryptomeria japonica]